MRDLPTAKIFQNPDSNQTGEPAPKESMIIPGYRTIAQCVTQFPKLKTPIVHELFREQEIVNIVGSSKTKKTFFAQYLGLCIALGRPFLNHFQTERNAKNVTLVIGKQTRGSSTR